MADHDAIGNEASRQLLADDVRGHIGRRVAEAVGELGRRVATLRGLASALAAFGELRTDSDGEHLEEAAAVIRAIGLEAVAAGTDSLATSARLLALAELRDIIGD